MLVLCILECQSKAAFCTGNFQVESSTGVYSCFKIFLRKLYTNLENKDIPGLKSFLIITTLLCTKILVINLPWEQFLPKFSSISYYGRVYDVAWSQHPCIILSIFNEFLNEYGYFFIGLRFKFIKTDYCRPNSTESTVYIYFAHFGC